LFDIAKAYLKRGRLFLFFANYHFFLDIAYLLAAKLYIKNDSINCFSAKKDLFSAKMNIFLEVLNLKKVLYQKK
jgi:hypothetical protein